MPLGGHIALEVGVLLADGLLDRGFELVAGESGKVVVGEILQLQLVRQTDEAGGEARADDRVGQAPRSCP